MDNAGRLVCDVRNPDNPRIKQRQSNWRTWREKEGIFYLERHETNAETGQQEDVWIVVDPQRNVVDEKKDVSAPMSPGEQTGAAQQAGFKAVELRTMGGEPFSGGEEPDWLWLVATK